MPLDRMLRGGQTLSLAASVTLLLVVLLGVASVGWFVGLMLLFTVGMGIASPGAMTQAMSVDARVTGSASGLYGCAQMGVGAICSALVVLASDQALGAATVLAGAGIVSQLCFAVATRSRPAPPRA
jgi:DHA1 family bicyclomycin/chloramphenicol resistance-like MFS transporter